MTDFKQWKEFLENYDIEFREQSHPGLPPVLAFGGVEIHFTDSGDFYDYYDFYTDY